MISHKTSDSTSAGDSVHVNLAFPKAPDRPALSSGELSKCGILFTGFGGAMPIVAIGLDDQSCILEYEVRLEAAKHRLVHLEVESPFLEFVIEKALDRSHFGRKMMAQSGLTISLSCFRGYSYA